jgi:1,4-dihydroxy-2-naphthoate octaprenyltransferase
MISAWIIAFRLRTLPLAFSSVLMGSILAYIQGGLNWLILALTLLTTLFLQILSNLANDYGDSVSGVDGDQRVGPSRTVQSGKISKNSMKTAIILFAGFSLISGIFLIFSAFSQNLSQIILFLGLGLLAIFAAINYTVGKKPYGYQGLGDLFVFLFFGLVGVLGSYFLHIQSFEMYFLLPASSCGLLAVGVLNVNNIRDIVSDKLAGKKSIPVRIGREMAIVYHSLLLIIAFILMIVLMLVSNLPSGGWLFILVSPLLIQNIVTVRKNKESNKIDPMLKQLAITNLIFVLLFGIGVIFL